MIKGCFCGMLRKKRLQTYISCKWCCKQGVDPPRKFARVTALERHQVKCKASYLLNEGKDHVSPCRRVLYQMILQQGDEIARLKARVARLEEKKNRPPKRDHQMSPKECWAARKDTMRAVFRHFGKQRFDVWFNPENISVPSTLAAVLFPILEFRGENKMCLKNIKTDDVYHFAKQIWGKNSVGTVDLLWFKELCETEFGQKLDSRNFNEANDSLVRTYERFVATDCRRGGNLAPQGLVRLARMGEEMKGCFGGYRDELWDEDGDILNPREETQQSDGSLVILEHPELPCL